MKKIHRPYFIAIIICFLFVIWTVIFLYDKYFGLKPEWPGKYVSSFYSYEEYGYYQREEVIIEIMEKDDSLCMVLTAHSYFGSDEGVDITSFRDFLCSPYIPYENPSRTLFFTIPIDADGEHIVNVELKQYTKNGIYFRYLNSYSDEDFIYLERMN